MAKGKRHGFYLLSEQEQNSWINALKPSVILLDPTENLKIGNLIGRGNFAKVHQCKRLNEVSFNLAMKTIMKKNIEKSRRNIVSQLHLTFAERYPPRD